MKSFITAALILMGSLSLFAGYDFYAFDNGLTHTQGGYAQAKLLKELGYAGMCTRPSRCTSEMLEAFDKEGLKLAATYVVVNAAGRSVPTSILKHFELLKGRETKVWLSLQNKRASMDSAVNLTRLICDAAADCGLDVVFYCHSDCFTERVSTCLDILERANRKNLGMGFTLCHFLLLEDEKDVESTLRKIGDDLKLVLLAGADNKVKPGSPLYRWGQVARPLSKGSFDLTRILRTLKEINFKGDVVLQSWALPGSDRENLKSSMDAWKKLNRQVEKR